ncbi:MAG TPA: hypothetical protein DDX39_01140 [Bacteroidales bacterium]|nr:MAG: hypothetical protein A2W98_06725 [Bacteroidetes bacterium GWF2_33_38]OFY75042.1 MAG: hypothetical protein A2265_12140 [Bacteroidetes bacterium RIFOXYA12_FULL_33_9]OFY90504.1 MAG: hypothetical protein A2236_06695 [Bacteroidetes bacterium RIFOXYA2_FULL_33_7]HBF87216.1 hypothetical protein [Bacteroidales bacterium]
MKKKIDLLSDKSILSIEQDEFDRASFVDAIADVIESQTTDVNAKKIKEFKDVRENMIVGIYGSWGFGKSSIINLLDENLNNRKIKSVYFNPWMYGSEEKLIHSLFELILENSGIVKKFEKEFVDLLKQYQSIISVVTPSVGKFTKAVVDYNKENSSAYYCKEKIDKLLSNKAKPLVIFIDDVDRLSKHEVHILLKTIRLIASFNHVIYVMAFDFDMVAKSIKENYVDGTTEDGKAFLEKIIQIPIRIPEIKSDALLKYAVKHLKLTTDIDLSKDPIFKLIIEQYFHTPRDIKRFINSFRFTQMYLKGIVFERDLVILELVRLKIGSLFEIFKIYYLAIKNGKTDDETYSTSIIEYLKKDFRFLNNGTLSEQGSEFRNYNKIFCSLFGSNHIKSLRYQNVHNQYIDYDTFVNNNLHQQYKNLNNPFMLVDYFEKVPDLVKS